MTLNWLGVVKRLTLWWFRCQRADFYRDLAEMFRRAEPLLGFLEGEIANAHRTGERSKIFALRRILARFQKGDNAGRIGYLLEDVMPRSDAMMLLAVDRAADKSSAFKALAEAVDNQNEMKKLALSYAALPALMLPLCFVLISILSRIVITIEQSTPVYIQEELWQGFNAWARFIANFTAQHGTLTMLVFLGFLALILMSLSRWCGPLRLQLESWPIFSLYRDYQAGLLFTSLAMLLKTGGTLKWAIEDLSQSTSPWMRWHLLRVLSALDDDPNAVIESFSRGLLSPHLQARAAALNRSAPTFSEVLIELGTKEGPRVLARVKATALIANIATVGLIGLVAAVMGLASITVPGRFATLMQPTTSLTLKLAFEAKRLQPQSPPP